MSHSSKKVDTGITVDSEFEDMVASQEIENAELIELGMKTARDIKILKNQLRSQKSQKAKQDDRKRVLQKKLIYRYLQLGYKQIIYSKHSRMDSEIQFWEWNQADFSRRSKSAVSFSIYKNTEIYKDLNGLAEDSPKVPLRLVSHRLINIGDRFVFGGRLVSVESVGKDELVLVTRKHNEPST